MRWLPFFLLLAVPALAATPSAVPTAFSPQDTGTTMVYGPAPVPNRDLLAPSAPAEKASTQVAPTLFTTPRQTMGMAYPPSSTVQDEQEQRMRPTPGLSLLVPLQ